MNLSVQVSMWASTSSTNTSFGDLSGILWSETYGSQRWVSVICGLTSPVVIEGDF